MLAVFESILPIFLLILAGNVLKRWPLIEAGFWPGLEQFSYFVLYPTLLFLTILQADFGDLAFDRLALALMTAALIHWALTLGAWPLLRAGGALRSQYSSVFQTAVRWNGFIAFAIADKIFPAEALAVVALVMATLIVPVNIGSVAVVALFGDRKMHMGEVAVRIARNPLVLSVLLGLVARQIPVPAYPPLIGTLDLVGRAALGMGLVSIGAGLSVAALFRPNLVTVVPMVLKLLVFPALVIMTSLAFGLSGTAMSALVLCAAVPTAMNGYLLAKQMGADAGLYAAVTTLQTVAAVATIPIVLDVARYFGG